MISWSVATPAPMICGLQGLAEVEYADGIGPWKRMIVSSLPTRMEMVKRDDITGMA